MFAIVEIGGKQYRVSPGDKLRVEKLEAAEGDSVNFDKVLLTADGEKVAIGSPYISGAVVEGKVAKQARNRKIIVFKYSSKTRYRKKKGHRQYFTEIEVVSIR